MTKEKISKSPSQEKGKLKECIECQPVRLRSFNIREVVDLKFAVPTASIVNKFQIYSSDSQIAHQLNGNDVSRCVPFHHTKESNLMCYEYIYCGCCYSYDCCCLVFGALSCGKRSKSHLGAKDNRNIRAYPTHGDRM